MQQRFDRLIDGPPAKWPKFTTDEETCAKQREHTHLYRGHRCVTDSRGQATPDNGSPLDIRVHAGEGFIPLWGPGVTLRWRFDERSLLAFRNPDRAAQYLANLLAQGVAAWGDAAPVRFAYASEAWDFEISVRSQEDCDDNGCVLASAYFPDGGQHQLVMYPTMFKQEWDEQVETMAHELGHVFGLRHFFAAIREWWIESELFGRDNPFSIMNYGTRSVMTSADREDLTRLYSEAWAGTIKSINGTPIRLVRPFSEGRFESQRSNLSHGPASKEPTRSTYGESCCGPSNCN